MHTLISLDTCAVRTLACTTEVMTLGFFLAVNVTLDCSGTYEVANLIDRRGNHVWQERLCILVVAAVLAKVHPPAQQRGHLLSAQHFVKPATPAPRVTTIHVSTHSQRLRHITSKLG